MLVSYQGLYKEGMDGKGAEVVSKKVMFFFSFLEFSEKFIKEKEREREVIDQLEGSRKLGLSGSSHK